MKMQEENVLFGIDFSSDSQFLLLESMLEIYPNCLKANLKLEPSEKRKHPYYKNNPRHMVNLRSFSDQIWNSNS